MAHRVFVSYHHQLDQQYADQLRSVYGAADAFLDRSLPEEIDSDDDDYVLSTIRTEHLKDSTVTIVLVGAQTWSRKWVDWEIYSSLRPHSDRAVNGLLGIVLPGASRLPNRLNDNYRRVQLAGKLAQVGYARIATWDEIRPPTLLDRILGIEEVVVHKHRTNLMTYIERAFENRVKTDLINNSRPRLKINHRLTPWWF